MFTVNIFTDMDNIRYSALDQFMETFSGIYRMFPARLDAQRKGILEHRYNRKM